MALDIKSLLCEEHDEEKKSLRAGFQNYSLFNYKEGAYNNDLEFLQLFDDPVGEEVIPQYTQKQFLRKVWIDLAKTDIPLDVFSGNFSEVESKSCDLIANIFSANFSYQASIGYNHEEPYTDYESYSENEPYLTMKSYYDADTKTTQMRQVTEYRKVERQRAVTRSRTVTDWQPFSGEKNFESAMLLSTQKNPEFNYWLFLENLENAKTEHVKIPLPDEQNVNVIISEENQKEMKSRHCDVIYQKICSCLPGDESRDVKYQIKELKEKKTLLYKVPEYRMTIQYKGKEYSRYTYPFGEMKTAGDVIENENDLYTTREKIGSDSKKKQEERKNNTKRIVEKRTLGISILTIAALLMSIAVSYFVRNFVWIGIAFVFAVCAFVFNTVAVKKIGEKEEENMYRDIREESKRAEKEIADITKNYKSRLLFTLNRKLQSLELEPATEEEVFADANFEEARVGWIDNPEKLDPDLLNRGLW